MPSTEHLRAAMSRCPNCGLIRAEGAWCQRCYSEDSEYRAAADHHAAVPDVRPSPVTIEEDAGFW